MRLEGHLEADDKESQMVPKDLWASGCRNLKLQRLSDVWRGPEYAPQKLLPLPK